jgi:hypothetical protein
MNPKQSLRSLVLVLPLVRESACTCPRAPHQSYVLFVHRPKRKFKNRQPRNVSLKRAQNVQIRARSCGVNQSQSVAKVYARRSNVTKKKCDQVEAKLQTRPQAASCGHSCPKLLVFSSNRLGKAPALVGSCEERVCTVSRSSPQ